MFHAGNTCFRQLGITYCEPGRDIIKRRNWPKGINVNGLKSRFILKTKVPTIHNRLGFLTRYDDKGLVYNHKTSPGCLAVHEQTKNSENILCQSLSCSRSSFSFIILRASSCSWEVLVFSSLFSSPSLCPFYLF